MLKIVAIIAALVAVAFAGVAIWVRAIPVPAARYHQSFAAPEVDTQVSGGFIAIRETDARGFDRLVETIGSSPRTSRLAGRAEDGHISFVTRTQVMGFPDVTNVMRTTGGIAIRGHLVVGRGDMGTNRRRIEAWLSRAGLS